MIGSSRSAPALKSEQFHWDGIAKRFHLIRYCSSSLSGGVDGASSPMAWNLKRMVILAGFAA
jgi:hypothetical protein